MLHVSIQNVQYYTTISKNVQRLFAGIQRVGCAGLGAINRLQPFKCRLYLRWDVIMRNIIFAVGGAHCVKPPRPIITYHLKAIPHNSKCRYGERGAAAAKPKAQIILDAAKVSATSGGNSEPKQGQRSQSARGFCPRSTMRVPQPDIIEHFGNADAVPQPPERCLSRKAGIMRCCLNITTFLPPQKSRVIFFPPPAYPWCRGEVL